MKYWIWLSTLPSIGDVTAGRLLAAFHTPEGLYEAGGSLPPDLGLTEAQRRSLRENRDLTGAARIEETCRKRDIRLLTIRDPAYPDHARACHEAPILLYYKGSLRPVTHAVGIIGARRCTQETKHLTAALAADCASKQRPVISGMAKGVDAYAHTACLQAGGYTIAFLAHGLDLCYPAEHRGLKMCLERDGLLLSEYPPGTLPAPYRFPRRNRLISAWSTELYVIAAGARSGTRITAEYAERYGREVTYIEAKPLLDKDESPSVTP